MTRRRLVGRSALALACAAYSAILMQINSDYVLLVGGSSPATVWGPKIGSTIAAVLIGSTIVLVFFAARRWRWPALALWLAVLAILTHRVLDGSPEWTRDKWLGISVVTWTGHRGDDDTPSPCAVAFLPALCFKQGGQSHRIVTFVPFKEWP